MVPVELFAAEETEGEDGEHDERDNLLYHFQLHERERSAVLHETHAVGRHLHHVFRQGERPREEDDGDERPAVDEVHFLQFQVAVPGERHENVGAQEQQNGVKGIHWQGILGLNEKFFGAEILIVLAEKPFALC